MNLAGSSSAANSRGTGVAKGHGRDIFQEFLSHVQFEALNLEDYTVRYTSIPIITIHDHTYLYKALRYINYHSLPTITYAKLITHGSFKQHVCRWFGTPVSLQNDASWVDGPSTMFHDLPRFPGRSSLRCQVQHLDHFHAGWSSGKVKGTPRRPGRKKGTDGEPEPSETVLNNMGQSRMRLRHASNP